MAVGSVGDELVAEGFEGSFELFCVGEDLLLIGLELGGHGLIEGDGEGGDGVVVGAALVAREDGEVDGAFEVVEERLLSLGVGGADALAEEDHGAAGAAERFMRGGCHDVGVEEGGGDDACGDQAGYVGHIDDEVGTDKIGDLAHPGVVDEPAVG